MSNRSASKMKYAIIATVVVIAGVTAAFSTSGRMLATIGGRPAAPGSSVAVQVEPAVRREIAEFVTAGGKIQPLGIVKISPEVSGEIVALPFKEGDSVKKGDLILAIKPDFYAAAQKSSLAAHKAAIANRNLAKATMDRALFEYERVKKLYQGGLVSESQYQEAKTEYDISVAQHEVSGHQAEMAGSAVVRADEELAKTSVYSPISGVVMRLSSQLGERVVGTATMAGTEIMQIADLSQMEARVDVGEVDVGLVQPDQQASIEVDAVRGKKFTGVVTYIANLPNNAIVPAGTKSQEATKFEVRIRVKEAHAFRPGMSASAVIQTRSKSNVVSVPIQSVTTRMPGRGDSPSDKAGSAPRVGAAKPVEVVFVVERERVRLIPIQRGISDESYVEIISGIEEGQSVVTGSYKAISRDLQDGTAVTIIQ